MPLTVACFFKSITDLIGGTGRRSRGYFDLAKNEMIANPEKYHALLVRKDQSNMCRESLNIQSKMIKSEATVKLLVIQLYNEVNCEQYR